jgi:hypothetical protein
MNGNPDGLRSLATSSKIPLERIRYVPDAEAVIIQSIERGVLFLMAFWSGPARRAFAALTEALSRLGASDLEVVVVDVDGSPELYDVPEFKGKVHGAGETAWIRHGQIIATSGHGLNLECFGPNTDALMKLP